MDKLTEQQNNPQTQELEEVKSTVKSVGWFAGDLFKILAVAFVLVYFVIRPLIAEPFIVSGSSMVPSYHNRDYLIVEKLSYRFGEPVRGDIIIMRYPKDPSQYFIKRIVALPGEQIGFRDGKVFIVNEQTPQGFFLDESYIPKTTQTQGEQTLYKLKNNEYFVLGDNRTASSDSRFWGPLPKEDIVGKVLLRVLPLADVGVAQHARY